MAAGNGPYDVTNHTNTSDKALAIHIAPSPADSPSGAFQESWVDMLITKGFDAGQPIVYLSTDARPAADRRARAGHVRARAERCLVQRR